jgi:hypothetical protein
VPSAVMLVVLRCCADENDVKPSLWYWSQGANVFTYFDIAATAWTAVKLNIGPGNGNYSIDLTDFRCSTCQQSDMISVCGTHRGCFAHPLERPPADVPTYSFREQTGSAAHEAVCMCCSCRYSSTSIRGYSQAVLPGYNETLGKDVYDELLALGFNTLGSGVWIILTSPDTCCCCLLCIAALLDGATVHTCQFPHSHADVCNANERVKVSTTSEIQRLLAPPQAASVLAKVRHAGSLP